jgi:hypothetical protein
VISRPWRAVALAAPLALALVTGCAGAEQVAPSPSPAPSTSAPAPTPTRSATEALAALAGQALAASWTATYRLQPSGSGQPATVTMFRVEDRFRIDIEEPSATTLFMTASDGYVSCRVEDSARTCLLVGPLDKPVPKVFDPGLQRIVTSNLAALAGGGTGLTVTRTTALPEDGTLPSAECFDVSGAGVDAGEYCLTATGLPRRVTYPTGTLDLTAVGSPPNPQVFTPPVTPTPVPTTTPTS